MSQSALSWSNATHYVVYRHCIGSSCKTYGVRCHVLKEMPDGERLKIRTFGTMWKGQEDQTRVAYVEKGRVRRLHGQQTND